MRIDTEEALYRIGALAPGRLGDIGTALLAAGADSPAVRELAWLSLDATWRDVGDLFDRVLSDLGRPALSEHAAAFRLAKDAASDIVNGLATPYEGAARIAYGPFQAAGQPDELAPFYYWADEWEDHPEYRSECEADILRVAAEFLTASDVRPT